MNASEPDYYEILQVSPSAEQEVIEAAYRRLARKYHPDVNPDPAAAQRMRLLNEAFEVLADPQKRAEYDARRSFRARHQAATSQGPTAGNWSSPDPSTTGEPRQNGQVNDSQTVTHLDTAARRVIYSPSWAAFVFGPIYLASMRAWWHALIWSLVLLGGDYFSDDPPSQLFVWTIRIASWIAYTWIGKRLAWSRRRWRTFDEFLACQRLWDKWAKGFFLAQLLLAILVVGSSLKRESPTSHTINRPSTVAETGLGLGPQAPIPNPPADEEYAGHEVLELTLEPAEETFIDFPLARDLIGKVACAFGTKTFTWSVRKPYPASEGTVEFFNEYQGGHRSYGTRNIGVGRARHCDPITVINRSRHEVLLEVRYVVTYRREGLLSPR